MRTDRHRKDLNILVEQISKNNKVYSDAFQPVGNRLYTIDNMLFMSMFMRCRAKGVFTEKAGRLFADELGLDFDGMVESAKMKNGIVEQY